VLGTGQQLGPLSTPNSPSVGPVSGGTANVWSGAENQPPVTTRCGHSPTWSNAPLAETRQSSMAVARTKWIKGLPSLAANGARATRRLIGPTRPSGARRNDVGRARGAEVVCSAGNASASAPILTTHSACPLVRLSACRSGIGQPWTLKTIGDHSGGALSRAALGRGPIAPSQLRRLLHTHEPLRFSSPMRSMLPDIIVYPLLEASLRSKRGIQFRLGHSARARDVESRLGIETKLRRLSGASSGRDPSRQQNPEQKGEPNSRQSLLRPNRYQVREHSDASSWLHQKGALLGSSDRAA
jgi:hypothetical protein